MTSNRAEAARPQNLANGGRFVRSFSLTGHCKERPCHRVDDTDGGRTVTAAKWSVCGCPRMSASKWRIHKAFLKARFSRECKLARPLTDAEQQKLLGAVRKQCDTRLLPRKKKRDVVLERLEALEHSLHSLSALVEQGMPSWVVPKAYEALTLVRNEALAVMEDVALRETCSHFQKQKRAIVSEDIGAGVLSFEVAGKKASVSWDVGSRLILCCDDCLYRREMYYLDVYKSDPPVVEDLSLSRVFRLPSRQIPALALQSAWSRVLDP